MLPKKRRVISDDDFSSFAASIGDDDDALSAQRRAGALARARAAATHGAEKEEEGRAQGDPGRGGDDPAAVAGAGAAAGTARGPKKRFKSTNPPRPSALDLMRATILGPPRARAADAAARTTGGRTAAGLAAGEGCGGGGGGGGRGRAPATPPKRKPPRARGAEATAADAAALPTRERRWDLRRRDAGARVGRGARRWQWSRAVIDRVNDDGMARGSSGVACYGRFNVAAADVRAAVGVTRPRPLRQAASAPEEERRGRRGSARGAPRPPWATRGRNMQSVRWLLDGATRPKSSWRCNKSTTQRGDRVRPGEPESPGVGELHAPGATRRPSAERTAIASWAAAR